MGMLALAGAIGGVGRGMEKNVEHNREVEMKELEEQREMRIRQFEAEQQNTRQEKGFTHEEGMQEKGFGQQKEMQSGAQKFTAGENEKERNSREKIAQTRADATRRSALSSQLAKRWESKVVKSTSVDAKGLPVENEVLSVFDKNSARTYIQEGNKFFPQGAPKTRPGPKDTKGNQTQQPIRDAARSEIDKLLQNPDQADNFVKTYGYIPFEFFNGMGNNAGVYDPKEENAPPSED